MNLNDLTLYEDVIWNVRSSDMEKVLMDGVSEKGHPNQCLRTFNNKNVMERGANPPGEADVRFCKNCMKSRKFWSVEGTLLRSANKLLKNPTEVITISFGCLFGRIHV